MIVAGINSHPARTKLLNQLISPWVIEIVQGALEVGLRSFGTDGGCPITYHTPNINYELVVSF